VLGEAGALTLLVADVGVAGVALVSFVELGGGRPVERVYLRPGGLPVALPDDPSADVVLDVPRLQLALRTVGEELRFVGAARTVLGRRLGFDLVVGRPARHETVNVLVPFGDTRFQLTSKQQALPARGVVTVDGRAHRFGPETDAFACLDYGRGRWPPRIEWCWGFGATARGGRSVGLNLGGLWTDGTGVTENGVVLDGRVHKIAEPAAFAFDRRDYMAPWTVLAPPRVDLRFVPVRERALRVPLGVVSLELHQMLGRYHGTVVDDSGAPVAIDGMLGLAEWFRGRW
jgi:hypothetical protein